MVSGWIVRHCPRKGRHAVSPNAFTHSDGMRLTPPGRVTAVCFVDHLTSKPFRHTLARKSATLCGIGSKAATSAPRAAAYSDTYL